MARAAPPWLWIVLARDHGPRNSSVRLVMHTLRSFMDKSGYTFVGQPAIARAACLSLPTVRKALEIAWQEKWIGVALHYERGGKDWRSYEYRSCIPDGVSVPAAHEELVDKWDQDYNVASESKRFVLILGKGRSAAASRLPDETRVSLIERPRTSTNSHPFVGIAVGVFPISPQYSFFEINRLGGDFGA